MNFSWPHTPEQSFGAQFRRMRIQAGLSLRETAKSAGLSPSFLTDVEFNRRMPSRLHMERLAKAIGRPVDDLEQHDPREKIAELLSLLGAHPGLTPLLTNICRRLERGSLTIAEMEEFANG